LHNAIPPARAQHWQYSPGIATFLESLLMKTKAAVAWKSGAPLTIETVDLEGPKFGEVLVEIKATRVRAWWWMWGRA
jgi:hypothetical protein